MCYNFLGAKMGVARLKFLIFKGCLYQVKNRSEGTRDVYISNTKKVQTVLNKFNKTNSYL